MTTVSSTTSTAATTTSSTTTSSSSSALDTDAFLSLLVESLQNQDPLNPTDTTEFTNQMLSYASYSQDSDMAASLSDISATLLSIQESLSGLTTSA